ncbi:PIN domain-containing protein [Ciceribacter lividus]|uniref:type II toxin-antitoxin system VapC family toxin n=1 Tax=Ciceribacter lividus TaxID=1197950 RepID=UPI000DF46F8B
MTVIDSCIIIDVMSNDSFSTASKTALVDRARKGRLFAPDIVFSEVCLAYPSASDAKRLFRDLDINIVHLDEECLFLAASTFNSFSSRNKKTKRQQIRTQKRILPDFYIGAFAQHQGLPLLTRDLKRKWGTDFPTLQIITP